MEIKAKYGYKRIDEIVKGLQTKIGIEDVLNNMRLTAIRLEKGHNDNGILVQMFEDGEEKGRLYATPDQFMSNGISYLFFEYFGTGRHAEMGHVGKSKHFIESGYTEWFIQVSRVDRRLNYPIVTINNTEFYIAHGMKSNHFLQDAEFETRPQSTQIVQAKLKEMLVKICR